MKIDPNHAYSSFILSKLHGAVIPVAHRLEFPQLRSSEINSQLPRGYNAPKERVKYPPVSGCRT